MNINIQNQPVARNILNIISEKGLKQKAVAKKAGYSDQQFCDMLNGRKIIRPYDALTIAMALEVDANALFGNIEEERGVRNEGLVGKADICIADDRHNCICSI